MNIPQLDSTYIANTYARFPVTIARGVLVISAKNKVRLLPALNIPMAQLEQAVSVLKDVCAGE